MPTGQVLSMIRPLRKLWFAADSPLEGDGFEPSVPSCDRPSANSWVAITPAKIPALVRFGRVINAGPAVRNRKFESTSLDRRVSNELYRRWASMEPSRDSRY